MESPALSYAGGEAIKKVNHEGNTPNGWTFWKMEDNNGSMKLLSEYRKIFEDKSQINNS